MIVIAPILFAIGAVRTPRKSWADKPRPTDVHLDQVKGIRRQRRGAIVTICLAPPLIDALIAMLVIVEGDTMFYAVFVGVGLIHFSNGIILLRATQRSMDKTTEDAGE